MIEELNARHDGLIDELKGHHHDEIEEFEHKLQEALE